MRHGFTCIEFMIVIIIIGILAAIAIPKFDAEKAQEAVETRLVEQNGLRVWSQTTNTEHTYSMWIMEIEDKDYMVVIIDGETAFRQELR